MKPSPEDLLNWMRSRRSIRRFSDRPVPPALLARILEAACTAPSAHNAQPWRFVVVAAGDARRGLADRMADEFRRDLRADGLVDAEVEARVSRAADRLVGAPAAVVLCCAMQSPESYPDERRRAAERAMAVQSASLAGGQLLLAAHAEGLGACWMCGPLFAPDSVRSALDLPEDWEPQAVIVLGWPGEAPAPRTQRPTENTVVWR